MHYALLVGDELRSARTGLWVQRENDRGSTEQITSLHSRKMILKLLCKGTKMTVPLNASTFHFSFHSRALSPGFIIGNGESQGDGS